MIAALAAASLVACLPGALLFRVPLWNRPARAALSAEERVFWAVLLSIVWSLIVVLGMAGAGAYSFERLIGTNAIVSAAILLVWRRRLSYARTAPRVSWSALLPAGLVAVGAFTYFPTAEYVIGGKDPGVYLSEGIQIAQRGSLLIADPVVATVPPFARDLFFPSHNDLDYYGVRFMGLFIQDVDAGTVVGQFPHLYPASIAVGYGLNGLSGARDTSAWWAMLGLVAVYLAGARIFGRRAGILAALLLSINIVQVWFAGYPNSEIVMQALLFGALLAFARATEGSQRFFGTIAGVLLGLLLFLRYEVVLAMGTVVGAMALLPVVQQRLGAAFGLALMVSGGAGLWYLANPMRAYAAYPLAYTNEHGGWWLVVAALFGVWLVRRLLRWERFTGLVRHTVPWSLAALLVGLAVYAYFFREEGGRLAAHDAMAFRAFGWYVTPWVLGAAVVGTGVFTATRFWRDPAFFMTCAAFWVFFFYKARIVPEHFWTMRRFVAVALPAALLMAAALATTLLSRDTVQGLLQRVGRRPVPAGSRLSHVCAVVAWVALLAVAAPTALVFWRAAAPVRSHVEYVGLIPRLETLAGRVGPNDLLLVEARNAGSDLHTLALPLAYIYARHVLVLNSPVPEKPVLEDFLHWAHTRYDRVLFLGGGGTDLLTMRLTAEPLAAERFQVPEYEAPMNRYPSGVRHKEFEYGLYRLDVTAPRPRGPIDMRIGAGDDLSVVRFHARETRPDTGQTFRWTGRQSYVLLLGMAPGARQVTIWMSNGGRPAGVAPADVEVSIDGTVLGTATPDDSIQPYIFPLSSALAAAVAERDEPARLQVRVVTWNPAEALGVNDSRDLGVVVTRVEVR